MSSPYTIFWSVICDHQFFPQPTTHSVSFFIPITFQALVICFGRTHQIRHGLSTTSWTWTVMVDEKYFLWGQLSGSAPGTGVAVFMFIWRLNTVVTCAVTCERPVDDGVLAAYLCGGHFALRGDCWCDCQGMNAVGQNNSLVKNVEFNILFAVLTHTRYTSARTDTSTKTSKQTNK